MLLATSQLMKNRPIKIARFCSRLASGKTPSEKSLESASDSRAKPFEILLSRKIARVASESLAFFKRVIGYESSDGQFYCPRDYYAGYLCMAH